MADSGAGRLELTWSNKDQRLLSHDDVTYEWVDPSDWRVSEVRLLDEVSTCGSDPQENLLIQGDALHALEALTSIPEYAERYLGKVRQVVIDPPFNTGQIFQQYDDNLEHSVWLTMLRDRLIQIHRLLSDDGSVWVQLDDAEQHRARCVLDEVFGAANFAGTVLWKRRNDPRNTAPFFSADHDVIHVYAKDANVASFNRLPRTAEMDAAYTNPDNDPRGPWRRGDLAARNPYSKGIYPVTTPSGRVIEGPPSGSYWRVAEEELKRLDQNGRVYWGADGSSRPYLKRFLSEVSNGRVPSTVWPPEEVGFVRNGKEEARALVGDVFATPKPERLLERIIHIGSDPGDIVLDCFAGSGTTAAVAHKMGRRWVTVELSGDTVSTFVRPRLKKVIDGDDPGGVTDAVGWQGGGGFTEAKVAPSMFETVGGRVVLSEWATGGQLADAVAAQLGFVREPDGAFAGRRGRTRLAVLDGMLTSRLAEHLVGQLDEQETVVVVAMALEAGVAEHLRALRPGSRARKVPRDLARTGRLPSRLVRLDSSDDGGTDR